MSESAKSHLIVAYFAFIVGAAIGTLAGKVQSLESRETPCAKRARLLREKDTVNE